MALIIEIRENEKRIRGYSAERLGDKKQGWNQYLVKKFVPLPVPTLCQVRPIEHEIFRIGVIRHKYEDGADVLAFKVLQLITETEKTVRIPRHEKKGIKSRKKDE
jgi:hypothetical protein